MLYVIRRTKAQQSLAGTLNSRRLWTYKKTPRLSNPQKIMHTLPMKKVFMFTVIIALMLSIMLWTLELGWLSLCVAPTRYNDMMGLIHHSFTCPIILQLYVSYNLQVASQDTVPHHGCWPWWTLNLDVASLFLSLQLEWNDFPCICYWLWVTLFLGLQFHVSCINKSNMNDIYKIWQVSLKVRINTIRFWFYRVKYYTYYYCHL